MAIPAVQPNTVFSVTFEGDFLGQQVMTVLNYSYLGEASVPHADAVAALQELIESPDGVYSDYLDCIPVNVTNLFIRYQRITPVRYAQEVVIPTVRIGNRPAAQQANIATVVTRQAEQAGRGFVSNLHLPGGAEGDLDGGYLTEALIALVQIFAEESTRTVNVGAGGGKLVPVAFKRSNPNASPQLVASYVQDTARVMRRRTVRVGS